MCKGLCFETNGKYQLQTPVNAGNVKLQFDSFKLGIEKNLKIFFSTNDVKTQVPEKTFCDNDVEMMTIFNGGLF